MTKTNIMKSNFFFLAVLMFLSCDNETIGGVIGEASAPNASVFSDVSSLIQDLKSESQTFDISDQTIPSTIIGQGGTIIDFAANSFTDSAGNAVTSGIVILLDEYLSLAEMMKNNIQTLSNGQLLVTGGSFNLAATDNNNNPLTINPGSINSQLPILTDITGFESGMSLFVGETNTINGIEQINWLKEITTNFG